jgi:hypothetical protein
MNIVYYTKSRMAYSYKHCLLHKVKNGLYLWTLFITQSQEWPTFLTLCFNRTILMITGIHVQLLSLQANIPLNKFPLVLPCCMSISYFKFLLLKTNMMKWTVTLWECSLGGPLENSGYEADVKFKMIATNLIELKLNMNDHWMIVFFSVSVIQDGRQLRTNFIIILHGKTIILISPILDFV